MKEVFSTIARFQYSAEAQIIKGRLEADGVKVFMVDNHTIDTDPLVSNAIGGVKLKVWAKDEVEAMEILNTIHPYSVDGEGSEIHCPKCSSSKVNLFTNVRDFKAVFFFWPFLFFNLFFNAMPFYTKYGYLCETCKEKFSMK